MKPLALVAALAVVLTVACVGGGGDGAMSGSAPTAPAPAKVLLVPGGDLTEDELRVVWRGLIEEAGPVAFCEDYLGATPAVALDALLRWYSHADGSLFARPVSETPMNDMQAEAVVVTEVCEELS